MTEPLKSFEYHVYVMRSGAEYGECFSIDAPEITMQSSAEIKKTLVANLIFPTGTDMLNDTLAVRATLNGEVYNLGEYYIGTYTEITDDYGKTVCSVEAYDGGFLPSRYRTEGIYHISAGSSYTDVIQALLIECGVEKIIASSSPETFTNDREDWEIGTTYLQIINDLLNEINYGSLWFDNDGFARIAPKRSADPDKIDHEYKRGKYSVLAVGRERETDVFDKYNVFIAYVDNADNDELMIAKSINDDPSSILSVQNRGRIQAPPERLDNIASQNELQAYVDNLKTKSMTSTETLSISTEFDRAHSILDTVQCEDELYLETGWRISLDAGVLMEHTLEREYWI